MKPKHALARPAALRVGRLVTVPLVLVTTLSVAGPALAAKPTTQTGGTAQCSVTPNPVPVNTDYTLAATGLGAGTIVNELVTDSTGSTTVWQLQADSSGSTSVVGHAYWTGTSSVTIQKQAKHGWTTLATCSFQVS